MTFLPFKPLQIREIPPEMAPEELLKQKGWYSLPDIFRVVFPEQKDRYKLVFKQVSRMKGRGIDPWREIGYYKFGHRIFVRMEKFGPWLTANPLFKLRKIPEDLSFEDFLNQGSGYYRLSEMCKQYESSLPFSYLIFKRQVDRSPNLNSVTGIFKFDKTYILDLSKFCQWLATQFEN